MDIKLQVALISGLVGSLIGVLVTMWQVRKQFEASAELQRRENRIPVMQKLWEQMRPFSFFGKPQNERKELLSKISNDLTQWYYKTGGLYLSETSQKYYVRFQEAIETIIKKYRFSEVNLNKLSHSEFHLLQEEASALRTLTARDCGTRIETDSKYGIEAGTKMQSKLENCKICQSEKKG
ncbi:MAG: hypothetical protein PVH87_16805 [Desulfobacteraceae bacterium]|jgi:hypothetical protein